MGIRDFLLVAFAPAGACADRRDAPIARSRAEDAVPERFAEARASPAETVASDSDATFALACIVASSPAFVVASSPAEVSTTVSFVSSFESRVLAGASRSSGLAAVNSNGDASPRVTAAARCAKAPRSIATSSPASVASARGATCTGKRSASAAGARAGGGAGAGAGGVRDLKISALAASAARVTAGVDAFAGDAGAFAAAAFATGWIAAVTV